jgi:putative ABC transport system ATP-binding protein
VLDVLEINGLYKVFGAGTVNEKIALNNVDFSMKPGEFVTVIGSNGAGKSTLLNCVAGVFGIDGGTISLGGDNITKQSEYKRARRIGRVFQDPLKGTAFGMTVEENLAIAWHKNKKKGLRRGIGKGDRDFFRDRLKLLDMGLEDRIKEKAKLLSGGQRQALTLFMAVIAQPDLLLLDEHTAALDPAATKKVLELTDFFADDGGFSVLMITHNMKAALEHGTRTILMNNGRIVMDACGDEREALTVETLVERFEIEDDKLLL